MISRAIRLFLRFLPARFRCRAGHALLRSSSVEHRAFTELFVPPYSSWVVWHSGLGDSIHALYGLCRAIRPNVVVEIGSARGRSTCALALACRQNGRGIVHAIDPHQVNSWTDCGNQDETYEFLRDRLRTYELEPYCRVVRATSEEAGRSWTEPIDLLFIDGDHTYEGVKRDFAIFKPWLSRDSLVVFHDTMWEYHKANPYFRESIGVPRFMHELKQQGYHSLTLAIFPGLTLLCPSIGGTVFQPQDALDSDGVCTR